MIFLVSLKESQEQTVCHITINVINSVNTVLYLFDQTICYFLAPIHIP